MKQSEFLAICCNLLKANKKPRVRGAIGSGIASKTGARFSVQSPRVAIAIRIR